jgi:Ca-activated chloride channel homolog
MQELQFQYREFILLFAGILLLVFFFISLLIWKRKVRKRIGDKKLIAALVASFSPWKFASKFIAASLAFALGVVAVMNPRKPGGADNITRKGIDVVVALDVSKSMLAADLAPTRLDRAKQLINKLMQAMPDNRIGLVLFAGKAYLQMPLTIDHSAAAMYVSAAMPDAIPQQGTVISDALTMSANSFYTADKRFKSVILISDGEDHDDKAIETSKEIAAQGIMVNAVGAGSPEGATITDPLTGENKKDELGNVVVSKLNEETLKQIAENTNGIYLHLQGSDEVVKELVNQLSQIEGKSLGDESLMNYKTWYMWFAGGMLGLLLIEFIISERKKRVS